MWKINKFENNVYWEFKNKRKRTFQKKKFNYAIIQQFACLPSKNKILRASLGQRMLVETENHLIYIINQDNIFIIYKIWELK